MSIPIQVSPATNDLGTVVKTTRAAFPLRSKDTKRKAPDVDIQAKPAI
jgi:hypothetical protein